MKLNIIDERDPKKIFNAFFPSRETGGDEGKCKFVFLQKILLK